MAHILFSYLLLIFTERYCLSDSMCYELSSSLLEPPYETGPVFLAPFDECGKRLGKLQGLPEPGSPRSSLIKSQMNHSASCLLCF